MIRLIVLRSIAVIGLWCVSTIAMAQQVPQTAPPPSVPQLHGFSIVLVLGEPQKGAIPDTVPAAARKALNDMKDFLPYKNYRLLDSSWILASTMSYSATSRMGGLDNAEYGVRLTAGTGPATRAQGATAMQVSFRLSPDAPSADAQAPSDLVALRNLAVRRERELAAVKERYGERHPEVMKAQNGLSETLALLQETDRKHGQSQAQSPAPLINTTFVMDVGETVVVGTSRVQGDKALIVLLTAVPRPKL